ncbi:MAG: BppU family phage baseplate upper protein [Cetobacterium sp.]
MNNFNLIFDVSYRTENPTIFVRQGDINATTLNIRLQNSGGLLDLTNYNLIFECVKPNGTFIRDEKEENFINKNLAKGTFTYVVEEKALDVKGVINVGYFAFEKVVNGVIEERFTTQNIEFVIKENATLDKVEGNGYVTVFEDTLTKVNQLSKEALDNMELAKNKVISDQSFLETAINNQSDNLTKKITTTSNECTTKINQLTTEITKKVSDLAQSTSNELANRTWYTRKEVDDKFGNKLENLDGLKASNTMHYKGDIITCDKSVEGKTVDLKLRGNTLQNLLPKVTKDLVINKATHSGVINLNSSTKGSIVYSLIFNVKSVTNYSNGIMCRGYNINGEFKEFGRNAKITKGINVILLQNELTVPIKQILLALISASDNSEVVINDMMLLEGDYTNKNIPNYIEGIKSNGEEEGKLLLKSSGKNVFNINSAYKSGLVVLQDGVIKSSNERSWAVLEVNHLNNISISLTAKVDTLNEYRLLEIYGTNSDGKTKYEDWTVLTTIDLTTNYTNISYSYNNSTKKYQRIILFLSASATNNFYMKDVQVEEGTQPTSYEPYTECVKEITLGEPLRRLDDKYYDEITQDGKLIRRIGKLVINGTEDWRIWKDGGTVWLEDSKVANFGVKIPSACRTDSTPVICNNFTTGGLNTNPLTGNHTFYTKNGEYIYCYYANATTNQQLGITINKSTIKVVESNWDRANQLFKSWLQANNVTIYYVLDNPIETQLNIKDLNLDTYTTITYMDTTNNVKSIIDVNIISDVTGVIKQNITRLNKIDKRLQIIEQSLFALATSVVNLETKGGK